MFLYNILFIKENLCLIKDSHSDTFQIRGLVHTFQVKRIFQSAPKKNQLLVKDKYLDIWGRCLNKVLQKSNGLNKV